MKYTIKITEKSNLKVNECFYYSIDQISIPNLVIGIYEKNKCKLELSLKKEDRIGRISLKFNSLFNKKYLKELFNYMQEIENLKKIYIVVNNKEKTLINNLKKCGFEKEVSLEIIENKWIVDIYGKWNA